MATLEATDTENPTAEETMAAADELAASRPFQFSAASSLTPSRQQSLENWHRAFLRTAASRLTDLLRLNVGLELDSVQIQSYGQMIEDRGEDNHCVLFRMHPQPGIWLLDLPVALSLLLVERMMGGPGVLPTEEIRELTELDQTVFLQFAETLLADYARSWKPHAELRSEVMRQVRNLNYQLIHQPDDLILRVGVRVLCKESKSLMWLVVPIVSVEDLLLRSLAPADRVREDEHAVIKDKKSPLGSVPVPVSIRWQGFQMSLREVDAMSVGDVLVLDTKKCESAAVCFGERAKFLGRVVRDPQKTTLTITGPIE
jgi:flagellar motor switch protein FliM